MGWIPMAGAIRRMGVLDSAKEAEGSVCGRGRHADSGRDHAEGLDGKERDDRSEVWSGKEIGRNTTS